MDRIHSKEDLRVAVCVPLFIIVAVFMVWLFKNHMQKNALAASEPPGILDLAVAADMDMEELFSHNLPVILDFGASWCSPCQLMQPTLVKLNEELKNKAIIKYVDIDELREFSSNFPITVVPTQFFYTADGAPFVPDESLAENFKMYSFKDEKAHALTAHEGYLDEQTILMILENMGMEGNE